MADGVAYLVSQYPALSHTFIEREVLALRNIGTCVETYSVRPADAAAPFPRRTLEEVARTRVLQGGPLRTYGADLLRLLVRSPGAAVAGIRSALRSGPRSLRSRLWQLFYLVEAVRLVRLMEQDGLTRIHVHHANNAADVARLAVVLGRRLSRDRDDWRWTLALHGPTEFLDPVNHDLRAKLESAYRVACISDYAVRTARGIAPEVPVPRFGIVRMSAPDAQYPPSAAARAARDARTCTVLFVGRLVPEKAPELVVEAVHALRARGLAVSAVIAGDGPQLEPLGRRVADLGLQDSVHLVGPVSQSDLPALYREADVFCLPSHAEGIPVVLMEAMLTELPVVTTSIAGIPELVRPGAGVLVPPGDLDALVDALESLCGDPGLRHRVGAAGRLAVLEQHRAEQNAVLLRDLITGDLEPQP